jgi:hypothetical protein
MRKLFYYSLLCAVWFGANSCKDEVGSPPATSLTVDKTSGLIGDTFTFTIKEAGADQVSLLPYGKDSLAWGGGTEITTFTNGSAQVTFSYAHVGTFQAVAVTNNHSSNGQSVKNVYSTPVTITITDNQKAITAFASPTSTSSTIDETAKTIAVVVPFGTDVTTLKMSFTVSSSFAKVTVGGATQVSGTTANNFTSPVTYTVTANDGSTAVYTVTVTVTPVEKITTIKAFTGTETSKGGGAMGSAVDNTGKTIVLYDVYGTARDKYDSVATGYTLDGSFAYLVSGTSHLKQGAVLNLLATTGQTLVVHSQDSVATTATYKLYATTAPSIAFAFNALNPQVTGTVTGFGVAFDVLNGTDFAALATTTTPTLPAGVTITGMKAGAVTFNSGDVVDYTDDVTFTITVNDTNIGVTYQMTYTVSVNVVK